MIDNRAAVIALRTALATVSAASSVDADVTATATGYTSALGNFVTRGFLVGMEVVPTGFTETTPGVISAITATTMTIIGGRATPQASGAGRTIAVPVPQNSALENIALRRGASRWFYEEEYLPGPVEQIALGPRGVIESLPQYVVKLYGIAGMGPDALYAVADAVLTTFAPRTSFAVAATDSLTVRTRPAPYRGQLVQPEAGWACVPVTIPLRLRSTTPS